MHSHTQLHLAGVGDFTSRDISACPDPCPLPETDPEKKKARRSLNTKARKALVLEALLPGD
jgi:hypothetical protein